MNNNDRGNMLHKLMGTFLIIVATVLWGSSFAVRKAAMADIGPLTFNTLRFLAAFVFMLVVYLTRRKSVKPDAAEYNDFGRQMKAGVIIGLLYSAGSVFQQLGLNLVSAGETGFVNSLYTVMVPVIARIIFKTKIQPSVWIAVVFSGTGLYFVTGGGIDVNRGMFLTLIASFCFALQIIAISKFIEESSPLLLVTVQLGIGVIVNAVMTFAASEPFEIHMIYEVAVPVIYTGIMSLGVANFCQFAGQRMVSPTAAAIVCSFESVFGLLFSVLLLNERMTGMKLTGCAFILAAVLLSQIKLKNKD